MKLFTTDDDGRRTDGRRLDGYTISSPCETNGPGELKIKEAAPVAERVRSLYFSALNHLTAVSGVGSSPALARCETRQVLLAGVSGGFPGVLPFRSTYRLARLYE